MLPIQCNLTERLFTMPICSFKLPFADNNKKKKHKTAASATAKAAAAAVTSKFYWLYIVESVRFPMKNYPSSSEMLLFRHCIVFHVLTQSIVLRTRFVSLSNWETNIDSKIACAAHNIYKIHAVCAQCVRFTGSSSEYPKRKASKEDISLKPYTLTRHYEHESILYEVFALHKRRSLARRREFTKSL